MKEDIKITEKKEKAEKEKNRNIFFSFLMGVLTIGVWNRFFPRKKGQKGSWAFTSFMMLILLSALIGERFFKAEINQEIKEKLQTNIDVIPESWGFEEHKEKYEDLLQENKKLKERSKNQEDAISDLAKKMMKYQNASLNLAEENKSLYKELTHLKENPEKVLIEPSISLISYKEIQEKVGCNSTYSEQKRIDVFKSSYKDKWVNWTGLISFVSNDYVIVNGKNEAGFKVDFKVPGIGYDLKINDKISLTFKLVGQGSCEKPFEGIDGIIIK